MMQWYPMYAFKLYHEKIIVIREMPQLGHAGTRAHKPGARHRDEPHVAKSPRVYAARCVVAIVISLKDS